MGGGGAVGGLQRGAPEPSWFTGLKEKRINIICQF